MNKLSKKELVLRFVERNGIVRRKDIIKFIVDLNYGKGTYDQNPEEYRGYYATHLCIGNSYDESNWLGAPKGYLLEGEDRLLRIERGIFVALRNGIFSNKTLTELPIEYHGSDVYQLLNWEIPEANFDVVFQQNEPHQTIDSDDSDGKTILVFTVNENTGDITQHVYPDTSTTWKTNAYSTTDADMAKSISDHIKYMAGEKESEIQEAEKIERIERMEDYLIYKPSEQVKEKPTVPKEDRKPVTPIIELPCKPGDEIIAIIEYDKNKDYSLKKINVREIKVSAKPDGTSIKIIDEYFDTYEDVQITYSFEEAIKILKTLTQS